MMQIVLSVTEPTPTDNTKTGGGSGGDKGM